MCMYSKADCFRNSLQGSSAKFRMYFIKRIICALTFYLNRIIYLRDYIYMYNYLFILFIYLFNYLSFSTFVINDQYIATYLYVRNIIYICVCIYTRTYIFFSPRSLLLMVNSDHSQNHLFNLNIEKAWLSYLFIFLIFCFLSFLFSCHELFLN